MAKSKLNPPWPTFFGVDFSSAPSKRKPIQIAQATVKAIEKTTVIVTIDSVVGLSTLNEFEQWLHTPGPWVGAFDMPFGLSRTLLDTLNWPGARRYDAYAWQALIRFYTMLTRDEIRQCFQAWCQVHPVGKKFAHRATDGPAKSSPSMKWINPPVAIMLHAGSSALLKADVTIPGCYQSRSDDVDNPRIALEAYPGWLARNIIGARSYKTDDVAKQNDARRQARAELIEHLFTQASLGVQLAMPPHFKQRLLNDVKGDELDAILCCIHAVAAWRQHTETTPYGLPPDIDPVEGWIAAVPWGDTQRREVGFVIPPQQVRAAMREMLPTELARKVVRECGDD